MKACQKETVVLLREARSMMRNDVDARAIACLDKAIEALESEDGTAEGRASSRRAALYWLGKALRWIPALKILFEDFM
ncbi:hypothetical protein [Arhodomonas sp. AD133]|uniref:hypothetical protein n=1 Tax=Arhodomonas sp. AD133 TaxID=3415009 RepID=UPI003EB8B516